MPLLTGDHHDQVFWGHLPPMLRYSQDSNGFSDSLVSPTFSGPEAEAALAAVRPEKMGLLRIHTGWPKIQNTWNAAEKPQTQDR